MEDLKSMKGPNVATQINAKQDKGQVCVCVCVCVPNESTIPPSWPTSNPHPPPRLAVLRANKETEFDCFLYHFAVWKRCCSYLEAACRTFDECARALHHACCTVVG